MFGVILAKPLFGNSRNIFQLPALGQMPIRPQKNEGPPEVSSSPSPNG